MADGADNWVFDSLVNFLRGPIWNVPILTLIENKSLGKKYKEKHVSRYHFKKIVDLLTAALTPNDSVDY